MQSLYGAKERKQEILTPQCIIDVCDAVWPEGIAFDPCPAVGSLVKAEKCRFLGDRGDEKIGGGLAVDWPARTYCNPPYKHLKLWMAHASNFDEWIMLCPVRTHRKWWRDFAHGQIVAFLNPLKFVGYDATFPAPLALIGSFSGAYYTRYSRFRHAVESSGIGEVFEFQSCEELANG